MTMEERRRLIFHNLITLFKRPIKQVWFNFSLTRRAQALMRSEERYTRSLSDRFMKAMPSLVVEEDIATEKVSAGKEFSIETFWEYLYSDQWNQKASLRIYAGELLTFLLTSLDDLHEEKRVVSKVTVAYSKQTVVPRDNQQNRTENVVLLEFIVYGTRASVEEAISEITADPGSETTLGAMASLEDLPKRPECLAAIKDPADSTSTENEAQQQPEGECPVSLTGSKAADVKGDRISKSTKKKKSVFSLASRQSVLSTTPRFLKKTSIARTPRKKRRSLEKLRFDSRTDRTLRNSRSDLMAEKIEEVAAVGETPTPSTEVPLVQEVSSTMLCLADNETDYIDTEPEESARSPEELFTYRPSVASQRSSMVSCLSFRAVDVSRTRSIASNWSADGHGFRGHDGVRNVSVVSALSVGRKKSGKVIQDSESRIKVPKQADGPKRLAKELPSEAAQKTQTNRSSRLSRAAPEMLGLDSVRSTKEPHKQPQPDSQTKGRGQSTERHMENARHFVNHEVPSVSSQKASFNSRCPSSQRSRPSMIVADDDQQVQPRKNSAGSSARHSHQHSQSVKNDQHKQPKKTPDNFLKSAGRQSRPNVLSPDGENQDRSRCHGKSFDEYRDAGNRQQTVFPDGVHWQAEGRESFSEDTWQHSSLQRPKPAHAMSSGRRSIKRSSCQARVSSFSGHFPDLKKPRCPRQPSEPLRQIQSETSSTDLPVKDSLKESVPHPSPGTSSKALTRSHREALSWAPLAPVLSKEYPFVMPDRVNAPYIDVSDEENGENKSPVCFSMDEKMQQYARARRARINYAKRARKASVEAVDARQTPYLIHIASQGSQFYYTRFTTMPKFADFEEFLKQRNQMRKEVAEYQKLMEESAKESKGRPKKKNDIVGARKTPACCWRGADGRPLKGKRCGDAIYFSMPDEHRAQVETERFINEVSGVVDNQSIRMELLQCLQNHLRQDSAGILMLDLSTLFSRYRPRSGRRLRDPRSQLPGLEVTPDSLSALPEDSYRRSISGSIFSGGAERFGDLLPVTPPAAWPARRDISPEEEKRRPPLTLGTDVGPVIVRECKSQTTKNEKLGRSRERKLTSGSISGTSEDEDDSEDSGHYDLISKKIKVVKHDGLNWSVHRQRPDLPVTTLKMEEEGGFAGGGRASTQCFPLTAVGRGLFPRRRQLLSRGAVSREAEVFDVTKLNRRYSQDQVAAFPDQDIDPHNAIQRFVERVLLVKGAADKIRQRITKTLAVQQSEKTSLTSESQKTCRTPDEATTVDHPILSFVDKFMENYVEEHGTPKLLLKKPFRNRSGTKSGSALKRVNVKTPTSPKSTSKLGACHNVFSDDEEVLDFSSKGRVSFHDNSKVQPALPVLWRKNCKLRAQQPQPGKLREFNFLHRRFQPAPDHPYRMPDFRYQSRTQEFRDILLRALGDFVVRKERITSSHDNNTITTITFSRPEIFSLLTPV